MITKWNFLQIDGNPIINKDSGFPDSYFSGISAPKKSKEVIKCIMEKR